jgi:tRNA dimethylallyltransferase
VTTKSPKILVIVGPTASGKTSLAKKIAKNFNCELISADSRQIYKEMDIGTAKDKSAEQFLIDIIEPDKQFSVAEFQEMATKKIKEIIARGHLPIIVGGTGLYIDALIYGYILPPIKKESIELRQKLEKLSTEQLIKKLKKIDPESADKIDTKNKRRIFRALEVSILNQRPFSKLKKKTKSPFDFLTIGIDVARKKLYQKIDQRVDEMVKNGLVGEVKSISGKYGKNAYGLNTICYKEIIEYLDGKIGLEEAIQKIKNNTHSYARRQLTWFRKNKDINWIRNFAQTKILIEKFLK